LGFVSFKKNTYSQSKGGRKCEEANQHNKAKFEGYGRFFQNGKKEILKEMTTMEEKRKDITKEIGIKCSKKES
jgi:hypothetical protein